MNDEVVTLSDPDDSRSRNRECKKAMKAALAKTLAAATKQGWTELEAAFFIAEAADEYIVKIHKKQTITSSKS
jgi:hypothetical protein